MIGCGPGQNCCAACRSQIVAPPVNLGELGFAWVALAQAAATTAAAVSSIKSTKDAKKVAKYQAQTAAIEAQSGQNTILQVVQSPAALLGIAAVAAALIMRR